MQHLITNLEWVPWIVHIVQLKKAFFLARYSPQHATVEYIIFDMMSLSHIPLEDNTYKVALGKKM